MINTYQLSLPGLSRLVPAISIKQQYRAIYIEMPGTIGERSDAVLRPAMAGHDKITNPAPDAPVLPETL
jgi:hypothetical protein